MQLHKNGRPWCTFKTWTKEKSRMQTTTSKRITLLQTPRCLDPTYSIPQVCCSSRFLTTSCHNLSFITYLFWIVFHNDQWFIAGCLHNLSFRRLALEDAPKSNIARCFASIALVFSSGSSGSSVLLKLLLGWKIHQVVAARRCTKF